MATPQDNTLVETLVEAFEDFTNTIIDGRATTANDSDHAIDEVATAVHAARKDLADALRKILAPRLRLIEGGRQDYEADTPLRDRPKCAECGRRYICADRACPHWHAALRACYGADKSTGGDVA